MPLQFVNFLGGQIMIKNLVSSKGDWIVRNVVKITTYVRIEVQIISVINPNLKILK